MNHFLIMLKGKDLLIKIEELGDASKTDLIEACGYATKKENGQIACFNYTAFYEALLEAKGVYIGTKRGTDEKKERIKTSPVEVIQDDTKLSGNALVKSEEITQVNKSLCKSEIANLMNKSWEQVNCAIKKLGLDNSQSVYKMDEVKLICNFLSDPNSYTSILKENPVQTHSLKKEEDDVTPWLIFGAVAAVGIFMLTRNAAASGAAYRGGRLIGGAGYAAGAGISAGAMGGVSAAGLYAARIAAMNAAAQAAANQQMLQHIVGIGMTIYGGLSPLYQMGSRGGVYRYTEGGYKHYI